MKGVVIFDERADMAFFSLDKEMEQFILGRMQELEAEHMGAAASEDVPHRELRDCLSAFFLPFFTSFDVLHSLKKPILSIVGADGHLIVFRKCGGDVYIAISKEDGDTEETMGRKLCVLNRIITLLHGPVSHRLNSPDINDRCMTWSKLSSLLFSYETLFLTDQVFLVEALEHVQFGQLSAAANVVQRLTRDSLDPQHNGGLVGVKHAMLLANTKFLAMCGRSPRIETSDILLITLLLHHYFNGVEDDSASGEEEDGGSTQDYRSGEESDERNDGELYTTPRSTPGLGSKENRTSDATPSATDELVVDESYFEQSHVLTKRAKETQSVNITSTKALQNRFKTALASLRSLSRIRPGPYSKPFHPGPGEQSRFMEQLVFLQPSAGQYVPHILYCLEVYPGIMLVMVAEHGNLQSLAMLICQTLSLLDGAGIFVASSKPSGGGQGTYDVLEDGIKKIKDQVMKESDRLSDVKKIATLRGLILRINVAWNNLKQAGIKTYLGGDKGGGKDENGPHLVRMEACGGDLKERLLKLFETLFMSPRDREFDINHVIKKLMRHFNTLNQDYGEFLALKGSFNIPIVSFSMSFPGMIHFLFIDRSFDELTSPSLSMDGQVAIPYVQSIARRQGETPAVFLRRKIWSMVQRVQKYLALGYTLQTWLDDDFLYTYFLWINIPSNASLGAPVRFFTPNNVKSSEHSMPGIIGSSFFGDIHTLKEGYVYELYCLHEPTVPIKEASLHCRNLAEQLWPSSREAVAPFSLIN